MSWKKALVFPTFKSGVKTDVSNYRPLSKAPNLSKILERIVNSQTVAFVENSTLYTLFSLVFVLSIPLNLHVCTS